MQIMPVPNAKSCLTTLLVESASTCLCLLASLDYMLSFQSQVSKVWNIEYEARLRRRNKDKSLRTISRERVQRVQQENASALHKDLQLRISCRGFSSQAPTELQQVRQVKHLTMETKSWFKMSKFIPISIGTQRLQCYKRTVARVG